MTRNLRTPSAAFLAALILALTVGSASATHLSLSSQSFRIAYNPLVLSGFSSEVRCNTTLEGSFSNASIAKAAGTQIGSVTAARFSHPCTGGEWWFYNGTEVLGTTTLANSFPWRVLYTSFENTLPNISGISARVLGMRFLMESTFLGLRVRCVYTTEELEPMTLRLVRNATTGVVAEAVRGGTTASETSGCPSLRFSGTGAVTVPGSTTQISVRLI